VLGRLLAAAAHSRRFASSRGNRKTGRSEVSNLLPNQFLQSHTVKLLVLEAKVKGATRYGFIGWIVERFEKLVLQRVVHVDSLFGVDLHHLSHDVQGFKWCSWKLLRNGDGCFVGELLHETLGLLGRDEIQIAIGKLSELLGNNCEL